MFVLADRLTRRRSLVQTPPKGAKTSAFQVDLDTQNYSVPRLCSPINYLGGRVEVLHKMLHSRSFLRSLLKQEQFRRCEKYSSSVNS